MEEVIPKTNTPEVAPVIIDDINSEQSNAHQEDKKRFLESLRARPEFMATIGAVALSRAKITVESIKDVDAKTKKASAYNQDVKPKTMGDRWVAWRLQRKLDKHATRIDENLTGAKKFGLAAKLRGISEREAIQRNNGKDDIRIRYHKSMRTIKKVDKKSKESFKKGEIDREALSKRLGSTALDADDKKERKENPLEGIVYRSGVGRFTGSQVERARFKREQKAEKLRKYAEKISNKSEKHATPEMRYERDAPMLLDATAELHDEDLKAAEEYGRAITPEYTEQLAKQAFEDVVAVYLGVDVDDIRNGKVDISKIEAAIEKYHSEHSEESQEDSEEDEHADARTVRSNRETLEVPIMWSTKLEPRRIQELRKKINADVKRLKLKARDESVAFDEEEARYTILKHQIPAYLGVSLERLENGSSDYDLDSLEELMDMIYMNWDELQGLVDEQEEAARRAVDDNDRRTALDL